MQYKSNQFYKLVANIIKCTFCTTIGNQFWGCILLISSYAIHTMNKTDVKKKSKREKN